VAADYRSEASMYNNAWFALGYGAGPVIAYVLQKLAKQFSLEEEGADILDAETLPGWFMIFLWVVFYFIHRKFYSEPQLEKGEQMDQKPTPLSDLPRVSIFAAVIASFFTAVSVSSWETWTMTMAQDRWGSPLIAGGYLAAVTLAILPVAVAGGRLSKVVSDGSGLLIAYIAATVSWAFLYRYYPSPYNRKHFGEVIFYTIGSICLSASLQLSRGFLDALVSKLTPPDRKQQMITASMSTFMLGRGVGGTLGSWFVNQNSWACFHMSTCLCTAFLLLLCLKSLHPYASVTSEPSHVSKRRDAFSDEQLGSRSSSHQSEEEEGKPSTISL